MTGAEEAIAWAEDCLRREHQVYAAPLSVLLALARDGQRWRERRPNGYAVVTPDGAYCCELREDAVAWMFAQRGPTNELREIFFGPVEPVTPSAETEK